MEKLELKKLEELEKLKKLELEELELKVEELEKLKKLELEKCYQLLRSSKPRTVLNFPRTVGSRVTKDALCVSQAPLQSKSGDKDAVHATRPTCRNTKAPPARRDQPSVTPGSQKRIQRGLGFYPVTSVPGICLIVNIDRYDSKSGLTNRDGSELDVTRIRGLFKKLNFKVKLEEDLKGHEISRCLQKMSRNAEHSECGAFVCFLMAHGNSDAIYGSDGVHQTLKDLVSPFRANSCPELSGKPKIFFIQACRCEQAEVPKEKMDGSKPVPSPVKTLCPNQCDFLFCYASSEDAPAYRVEHGSLFIQTLCDVIEEHPNEHLLDMTTEVTNRVTANPVEVDVIGGRRRRKKVYFFQVPDTHSQLTRKVSLNPLVLPDTGISQTVKRQ